MNIKQLEHIADLLGSMEVDCYPNDNPALADLIDGSIGELSPFHETFGYYAHGIGPETAALPAGCGARVVRLQSENTGGTIGLCLSPADLAVSKLLAGRQKDIDFVRAMLKAGVVGEAAIRSLAAELNAEQASRLDVMLTISLRKP